MKRPPSALTAPWAITAEGLQLVLGVWSRSELYPEVVAAAREKWKAGDLEADAQGAAGVLKIVGDVAVINVRGPLFRHASMFADISGATSYDALWKAFEGALATDGVKSILMRVNSPGGEVDGLNELAQYIATANTRKPVTAYADGMCASAAYWLASQAGRIVAEQSAEIGSIGVRISVVDDSEAQKQEGKRTIEIVSEQSPDKRNTPIDDEVIGRLQQRANDLAGIFVESVARGRGVKAATVIDQFGAGDVMIASKAVSVGMVDEIGDFNSTLASLTSTRVQGAAMPKKINVAAGGDAAVVEAAAPVAAAEPWKCAKCDEQMGPDARAYCAKCSSDEGEDDDEPDGDEARAFGGFACEALGVKTLSEARGALGAAVESHKAIAGLRDKLAALEVEGRKRDLRAALSAGFQTGRLSLGAIQKSIGAFVLRGEVRTAWADAMGKLESVSRESVIEAACSVPVTADDLAAIGSYIDASAPTTAPTATEPPRDAQAEANELDADAKKVADIAAKVRAHYAAQTAATAK